MVCSLAEDSYTDEGPPVVVSAFVQSQSKNAVMRDSQVWT